MMKRAFALLGLVALLTACPPNDGGMVGDDEGEGASEGMSEGEGDGASEGMSEGESEGASEGEGEAEGSGDGELDPLDEEVFLLGANNVPLVMKQIPAGTFMMGQTGFGFTEVPVHEVTLTQSFQLGKFEVTQAQWEAVMGTTPWLENDLDFDLGDRPDSPAAYVTWEDAQEFITVLKGLTGETFRLPTEAEWEYACRAGSTTSFYFGDSTEFLSDYAWFGCMDECSSTTQVVGQLIPNAFGLFDMHGNVEEWCQDYQDSDYYSVSPSIDPPGPATGNAEEFRVVRGGTWGSFALTTRSATRGGSRPGGRTGTAWTGFRIAR